MFHLILDYIKNNPLEIPAFTLSVYALYLLKRRYKVSYSKVVLQRHIGTDGETHVLKIYPPTENQTLSIIDIPIIKKRLFPMIYKKLDKFVNYYSEIDQETNQKISNIHYIHLSEFSALNPGNYLIKVKIDNPPYKLKHKFQLPIIETTKQNRDK